MRILLAGTFVGGMFGVGAGAAEAFKGGVQAVKQALPKLTGEAARVGIEKIGDAMGIDKELADLAGIPVTAGIDSALNGRDGYSYGTALKDGVTRGLTSMALNKIADEIAIDPLLFATITRALTGGLDETFNAGSFFKGAAEGLAESLISSISFRNVIDDTVNGSDPVTYSMEMINFLQDAESNGVSNAFSNRLTGIMFRDTVENLTAPDGIIEKVTTEINSIIKNTLTAIGEVKVIDKDTVEYKNANNETVIEKSVDGEKASIEMFAEDGTKVMEIKAGENKTGISFSEDGAVTDGVIIDKANKFKVVLDSGQVKELEVFVLPDLSAEEGSETNNLYVSVKKDDDKYEVMVAGNNKQTENLLIDNKYIPAKTVKTNLQNYFKEQLGENRAKELWAQVETSASKFNGIYPDVEITVGSPDIKIFNKSGMNQITSIEAGLYFRGNTPEGITKNKLKIDLTNSSSPVILEMEGKLMYKNAGFFGSINTIEDKLLPIAAAIGLTNTVYKSEDVSVDQDYYVKAGSNAIYYKQTQINGGAIITVETKLEYTNKAVRAILGFAGLYFLGKTAIQAIGSAAGKYEIFKKVLDAIPAFG